MSQLGFPNTAVQALTTLSSTELAHVIRRSFSNVEVPAGDEIGASIRAVVGVISAAGLWAEGKYSSLEVRGKDKQSFFSDA